MRRQWEEAARRSPMAPEDFSRFVDETWDPEISYEEDPRWPGSSSYQGREEVKSAFVAYGEIMGRPTISVEKIVDAGDEQIVLLRLVGSSAESGVPWEHLWAYRCRLRDGKLVYFRAYWDPEEALRDAGVS